MARPALRARKPGGPYGMGYEVRLVDGGSEPSYRMELEIEFPTYLIVHFIYFTYNIHMYI